MAMLKKLTLIKSVASNRFGELTSLIIFSSVLLPDVFNTSMSVGVSEKNADSAAETKAVMINNRKIATKANKVVIENDLITILRRGRACKNGMVLWTGKVLDLSEYFNCKAQR